jgi:hypothetical protein
VDGPSKPLRLGVPAGDRRFGLIGFPRRLLTR